MGFISEKEVVSLLLHETGHIGHHEKPRPSGSASESWSIRPETSSPLSICHTNAHHLVVSGASTFANETRQIVSYNGKKYWIWHSTQNSSEVLSIDSEMEISVELFTKHLILSDLFFSSSGDPLFIAQKASSTAGRQNYIIFCDSDFSIRWKYSVGKETVYKVLFLSLWNSVICVTQSNMNGYLFKTIYTIDLSGALVWKKQLPLSMSGGALSISIFGNNLDAWYGDQHITLSSSGELQQSNTYDIMFLKIISAENAIYTLASNVVKRKNIKKYSGTVISTSRRKAIYRMDGDTPPIEIVYNSDLVDFWIVQGNILFTTLNSAGIWHLVCCSLEGVQMWSINLLANLSCAPIDIGNGFYLLCTNPTYMGVKNDITIQEMIVSKDGEISNAKLCSKSPHPLQDAYVQDKTIWCLRSGTTDKVNPEDNCTMCEWEIGCYDNPV